MPTEISPTATLLIDGKRHRATTIAVIFDYTGRILVGHVARGQNKGKWEFGHGGVHKVELQTPHQAMLREIEEEFGIKADDVKHIASSSEFFTYDVVGQHERYDAIIHGSEAFVAKPGVKIVLDKIHNNEPPEFDAYQWTALEHILEICPDHKRDVFASVVSVFTPVRNALVELQPPSERLLSEVALEVFGHRDVLAAIERGKLVTSLPKFPGELHCAWD